MNKKSPVTWLGTIVLTLMLFVISYPVQAQNVALPLPGKTTCTAFTGYVVYTDANGVKNNFYNSCLPDAQGGLLKEYTCQSAIAYLKTETRCQPGCYMGHCITQDELNEGKKAEIVPVCSSTNGVTTWTDIYGVTKTEKDSCVPDNNWIFTWYCNNYSNGQVGLRTIKFCGVNETCSDGKCVSKQVPTCSSSNGLTTGVDINGTSYSLKDECVSGLNMVKTYYCYDYAGGKTYGNTAKNCASNETCSDGKCVAKLVPTCTKVDGLLSGYDEYGRKFEKSDVCGTDNRWYLKYSCSPYAGGYSYTGDVKVISCANNETCLNAKCVATTNNNKPDLVISEMKVEKILAPDSMGRNTFWIRVSYVIKNIGTTPSGQFYVGRFHAPFGTSNFSDYIPAGTDQIESIAPGSSYAYTSGNLNIDFSGLNNYSGTFLYMLYADVVSIPGQPSKVDFGAVNNVAEIAESNNHLVSGVNLSGNGVVKCTDSDQADYFKKGLVSYDGIFDFEDKCDGTQLKEAVCITSMSDSTYKTYDCPNSCKDGACIAVTNDSKCVDSDGLDYYNKGYRTERGSDYKYYDTCGLNSGSGNFEDYVMESVCSEDGVSGTSMFKCPNGCKDGACIKDATTNCTDSDNGLNYDVKGYVTDRKGTKTNDQCLGTTGNLLEISCNKDYVTRTTYKCPNGCKDGACIKNISTRDEYPGFNMVTDKKNYSINESVSLKLGGESDDGSGRSYLVDLFGSKDVRFGDSEKFVIAKNVIIPGGSKLINIDLDQINGFVSGGNGEYLLIACSSAKGCADLTTDPITLYSNSILISIEDNKIVSGICGNDQINSGEVCDGNDLAGLSCKDKGYSEGILRCSSDCKSFSVIGCTNYVIDHARPNDSEIEKKKSEVVIDKDGNVIALRLQRKIEELEKKLVEMERDLTTKINSLLAERLKGQILIQAQEKGEVWFVHPKSGERFFIKDGASAYEILSGMGTGISTADLEKIPLGYNAKLNEGLLDTDSDGLPDVLEIAIGSDPNKQNTDGDKYDDLTEYKSGYRPDKADAKYGINRAFAAKLKGIYIDVANRGAAWYIKAGQRYYISPENAYNAMKYLSLGVSNTDLRQIGVGEVLGTGDTSTGEVKGVKIYDILSK